MFTVTMVNRINFRGKYLLQKIREEDSAIILVKYGDCVARVKVVSTDIFEKY